jgi:hypothetical protein
MNGPPGMGVQGANNSLFPMAWIASLEPRAERGDPRAGQPGRNCHSEQRIQSVTLRTAPASVKPVIKRQSVTRRAQVGAHTFAPGLRAGLLLALAMACTPFGAAGQVREDAEPLPQDSSELNERARELQTQFESFRQSKLLAPLAWPSGMGCDVMLGRICKRHGKDYPWPVDEEPVEMSLARMEMLKDMGAIHQLIPGDGWVLAQMVLYLGEEGRWDAAEGLLRNCRVPEPGWCEALRGLALHRTGRFVESEEAFRLALEAFEDKELREWTDPRYALDPTGDGVWGDLDGEEADTMAAWIWHLADPLYMVDGNDRWTEQMSRWTEIRAREEAEHPFGIPWGFDLQELLMRYGASIAWERRRQVQTSMRVGDTPDMVGRSLPHARQFMPPGELIEDPTGIPWGAWELNVNSPYTAYAPSYSPIFRPLDFQVARFRRGDSLRVVAAYTPGPGTARSAEDLFAEAPAQAATADPFRSGGGDRNPRERNQPPRQGRMDPWGQPQPFGGPVSPGERMDPAVLIQPPPGPLATGALFLSPGPGREPIRVEGAEGGTGVYDVTVLNGQYVVSLEVYDEFESRAWRARQGARQANLIPGLTALSDVLLVKDVPNLPESLEGAIPDALPGHEIRAGGSVIAAWEVYGLEPGEPMAVNVAVNEADGDFFQRIGELLRLSEPEEPVVMTWEEGSPDGMRAFFRSVRLSLPNLEPGRYVLSIEVVLPGRDAMVTSTPLVISG